MDDPVNKGLPLLEFEGRPYSFYEFWPAWVFYFPVALYWLWLGCRFRSFSLPLCVNQSIYLSGMIGESKSDILDQFGGNKSSAILNYHVFGLTADSPLSDQCAVVIAEAGMRGVTLPFVVKPDLGCRGSGVKKVDSIEAFEVYLTQAEKGKQYIVQALAPYTAEAGVFYQRKPGCKRGDVSSLTLKYLPYVCGDGVSTIEALISADRRANRIRQLYFFRMKSCLQDVPAKGEYVPLAFAGSHCLGAVFKNGNAYITPALTAAIDDFMAGVSDFHYGRLDVKFRDLAALQQGKDFCVIEINGASSEATHIWDAKTPLKEVFYTLFRQYRTLFEFGDTLRKTHELKWSVATLIRDWLRDLLSKKREVR